MKALLPAVAVVLLLGSVFCPRSLWAQTQDERAIAIGLFEQGRQLRAKSDYAAATLKFEGAAKLMRTYGILMNLAECYEQLGRTASAWSTWREAEAVARTNQNKQDEIRAAERVRALESHLSYLTVMASESARKLEPTVLRNGALIPTPAWSNPIPVDPGLQRIEARAPGHRAFATEFTLKKDGDRQVVEIPELEPEAALPSSTPAAKPTTELAPLDSANTPANTPANAPVQSASGHSTWTWVGWATVGAGFVTSLVGVGVWRNGQGHIDDAVELSQRAISNEDRQQYSKAESDLSSSKTQRTAGLVTMGAGAVLCGAGLAVLLGQPRAGASTRPSQRAGFWFDGKNAQISVTGSF